MRNFFSNLSYRLQESLQNRNGMDKLAQYMLGAGIVLIILEFIFNNIIIAVLAIACLAYAIYRCYSKNVSARALENARFESWIRKPKAAISQARNRWANRSTTKYFKCSNCKQSLSVPKGKGTLRVTCPKCHAQTTIKS